MNIPLFLKIRGGESDIASIRYHLHYAAESALTALVSLFPPEDVEVPDLAVHEAADADEEYTRLRERATIAHQRVRDRVRPEVQEHVDEAVRAERERGDRLALIAFRLAIYGVRKPDEA